jgi:formamidopyrimidine-DNA glycosylase
VPELPEVEVVRAGLARHVLGRSIEGVEVLHPRPVRRDPRGSTGFVAALVGRRIEAAHRRGKYLWLALDNDDALLGHLGMSGQVLLGSMKSNGADPTLNVVPTWQATQFSLLFSATYN